MDGALILLGALICLYRTVKIRFKDDWIWNWILLVIRQIGFILSFIGLLLGLSLVIGSATNSSFMLVDSISRFSPNVQKVIFISALVLAASVVFILFRVAYLCMYHTPVEFIDRFGVWEEELSVTIPSSAPSDRAKFVIESYWHRPCRLGFIRYKAISEIQSKIREMRMNFGRLIVTTIPSLILSFSVISSTGQTLNIWRIRHEYNGGSLVDINSLLDHLYFVCSVLSTLGMGDSKPVLDNSGMGAIFLISILTIFMISGLIAFSLLIAFAHSFMSGIENDITNTINDSLLDKPRLGR